MSATPLRDPQTTTHPDELRCPACKSPTVQVTLRTTATIYYRCEECRHLWSGRKPFDPVTPE